MYNMTKTYTSSQARKNFFTMLKEIKVPGVHVVVTHGGLPAGVFMSADEFDGWMETIDIMSDPEEVAAIKIAMEEKDRGEVVTFEEFQKNLGL